MPEEFERYGETWRDHHPDWEMRLWTDSNLPEIRFPDALAKARNHGERSDLLRYELLVRTGGVYVDTDVECLKAIDPLLDGVTAFAGRVHGKKLGSAVLGAVPGHPAIERVLREGVKRVGVGHQAGTVGPRLLTEVLKDETDVRIFDPDIFYPFHHRRSPERAAATGAYAIHHVEASWKTREDLRNDIRRVRNRLEKHTARLESLRVDTRELRKRNRRAGARGRRLERALGRSRRRLAAVEGSRWWRLRRGLARAIGPLRRTLRAAGARLRSGNRAR
jgi:mannosyltransferase OCH1-like enzyme